MTPTSIEPWAYTNFGQINMGQRVHLKLVGQDQNDEPEYADAELTSAVFGEPGQQTATFILPAEPWRVTVNEVQYTAWNRYRL